ncbi:MAG: hypothetical protein AAF846_15135 [Chloroflexota bacterium]
MKLHEFSDDELQQLIEQLERTAKTHFDKHKRWEAQRKLVLAQREQHNRNPINRVKNGFKKLFGK